MLTLSLPRVDQSTNKFITMQTTRKKKYFGRIKEHKISQEPRDLPRATHYGRLSDVSYFHPTDKAHFERCQHSYTPRLPQVEKYICNCIS